MKQKIGDHTFAMIKRNGAINTVPSTKLIQCVS